MICFLLRQNKPLADSWIVFDTSGKKPIVLDESRAEK